MSASSHKLCGFIFPSDGANTTSLLCEVLGSSPDKRTPPAAPSQWETRAVMVCYPQGGSRVRVTSELMHPCGGHSDRAASSHLAVEVASLNTTATKPDFLSAQLEARSIAAEAPEPCLVVKF